MKKVFLLSLGLILGLSAFAQRQVIKNDLREHVANGKIVAVGNDITSETYTFAPQAAKSAVVNRSTPYEDSETMWSNYDLQSNHYVANRMYQLPNGNVAVTATMSHQPNQSATDRGTGYNFYSNGGWDDMPEARVESFRTGWPTIAQWGENGEILLCHGNNHTQCFTRETAGEGEWQNMGPLPDTPEGYPYTEYPTWPRVVTCGDNHNIIIAVACLQHQVSSDETHVHQIIWRSEDAVNWTINYSPLANLGLGYEVDNFSADDYALAANGHNVALLYSGCLTNSVFLFNSTDDGLTWTSTKVFEHPFEGVSLEEPGLDYRDTLFMPMNGAVVIDNNGVTHVALNTFEFSHFADTQPGYYSYWSGRSVDGILYWNSTQEAPIQATDGNPFHAARLWWPAGDDYVQMVNDSTRWIGMIPMFEDENGSLVEWNNDMYYTDNYSQKIWGASGHPALSCDPEGNLACAFSSPCTLRDNGQYYYRSIFVSYKNANENYWHQLEDDLMEDVMLMYSEGLYTSAVSNTVNPNQFWFSYQVDDEVGFYWGGSDTNPATQNNATENVIHAAMIWPSLGVDETEAQDVVYSIYPNPATDYIMVSSAMDANATITFTNLAGQTVKTVNKNLTTGENSVSIDLESGIYFCTVNANGFNKTVKVIVK